MPKSAYGWQTGLRRTPAAAATGPRRGIGFSELSLVVLEYCGRPSECILDHWRRGAGSRGNRRRACSAAIAIPYLNDRGCPGRRIVVECIIEAYSWASQFLARPIVWRGFFRPAGIADELFDRHMHANWRGGGHRGGVFESREGCRRIIIRPHYKSAHIQNLRRELCPI